MQETPPNMEEEKGLGLTGFLGGIALSRISIVGISLFS